jgi:hypothetical protein
VPFALLSSLTLSIICSTAVTFAAASPPCCMATSVTATKGKENSRITMVAHSHTRTHRPAQISKLQIKSREARIVTFTGKKILNKEPPPPCDVWVGGHHTALDLCYWRPMLRIDSVLLRCRREEGVVAGCTV